MSVSGRSWECVKESTSEFRHVPNLGVCEMGEGPGWAGVCEERWWRRHSGAWWGSFPPKQDGEEAAHGQGCCGAGVWDARCCDGSAVPRWVMGTPASRPLRPSGDLAALGVDFPGPGLGGEAAEDGIPMPGSRCSPPARPGHGREDGQLITCEVEAVPGRRQGSQQDERQTPAQPRPLCRVPRAPGVFP